MILSTKVRNAMVNAMVDLLDEGAGAGKLVFAGTGGTPRLCPCTFTDPAFGDAALGIATASPIGEGTVVNSLNPSTIVKAIFEDSDQEQMWELSVGLSGADVDLLSVAVNNGDTIAVTSLTITMPESET